MSASLIYAWKSAEKREAYEAYNYAGVKLKLAQIHERLAEIESQWEPLSDLCKTPETREMCIAFAKFVINGSWPANTPQKGKLELTKE